MKLGILTFHQALNYGAILQTYALQRYIKDSFPETDVQIVDYRCEKLSGFYSLKGQQNLSPVKKILKTGHFILKKAQFDRFIRSHIAISPKTYRPETIAEANDRFDKFLAGSDQVWNPTLTDGDWNYMLEFAQPEKRYSYAASIGLSEFPPNRTDRSRELLETFRGLSVREAAAKDMLDAWNLNQQVYVHPDPALLLKREHWETVCRKHPRAKKDYVLIFAVEYSEKLIREGAEFARERGMDAIYIGPYKGKIPVQYLPFVSLPRLLAYFRDARYVMINSFHGTVFSVIFHKDFYASLKYQDGRNSRILNLLELTGLAHRTDRKALDKKENWALVDHIIDQQRSRAHEYLEWILKHEN